jgi:hypothetical protein
LIFYDMSPLLITWITKNLHGEIILLIEMKVIGKTMKD